MRITIEVVATPAEADDLAHELINYLSYVEQVEILNYWVEASDE